MKKYTYEMTGILDGWKIISERGIIARTEKEAKSKLRRMYPKIQSIIICGVAEIGKQGTTITPRQRVQLKRQLAERTKIRRRKEDERRQHIYK